jgi:hypothetical protein
MWPYPSQLLQLPEFLIIAIIMLAIIGIIDPLDSINIGIMWCCCCLWWWL